MILKHNSKLFKRKYFLEYVLFAVLFLMSGYSYALNDEFLLPAVKSKKALSIQLNDITNAGNQLVAVGKKGHILFSQDSGVSWEQANVPVSVSLTSVYFPSPDNGWAVGQDGIVLHTADGGKTWVEQFNGLKGLAANVAHAKAVVKEEETELMHATAEEKSLIEAELENNRYIMEDYADAAGDNYCCSPLLDVWFKNETKGFVIGSYGAIYHTRNGGATWTPWWDHIDNPDCLHLNGISEANGAIFIVGESGGIYRSMDDGNSFNAVSSPYDGTFFGVISSPAKEWVIAFGLRGNYVCSDDLGETWRHYQAMTGVLSGAALAADGSITIVSYSGNALSGVCGEFVTKKIGGCLIGVAEAPDGHLVVVGLGGVHRVEKTDGRCGGK